MTGTISASEASAAVLRFWFNELTPADWFRKSDAVDAAIRDRFGALQAAWTAALPDDALATPAAALAGALVLDQFPRNMFRGTAAAFASDAAARTLAREAIARGHDRALYRSGRLFLYLPFEHSEDAADQLASVALIGALGDDELTRYAVAHKVIIDRFGRFPHRNAALGRTSTAEEVAFLQTPGSSF